jgi:hypothetical protein
MSDQKPIAAWVFDPRRPSLFFKRKKNDHAQLNLMTCSISEKCPLFAKNQCMNSSGLYSRCIFGRKRAIGGPTGRARGLNKWISDYEKEYASVWDKSFSATLDRLTLIEDWVWVPYSHATMNNAVPFKDHAGEWIGGGSSWIKKEDFTPANIRSIILFRPQALFGGEISGYQREEMPKFVLHLAEVFPDLYEQTFNQFPELAPYRQFVAKKVGRKAYVKTLKQGCSVYLDDDKKKGTWCWTGLHLVSHDFRPSFFLRESEYTSLEVKFVPTDTLVVTVTSEDQVVGTTVFAD